MNQLIPTTLIALGAMVLSAPTSQAQGTSMVIPPASSGSVSGNALSADGQWVAGLDATGAFIWSPVTGKTYMNGSGTLARDISAGGFAVAGSSDDVTLGSSAAGYWQNPAYTFVSLGEHPNMNGGCPGFGQSNAISDNGATLGGEMWDGCNSDAFTWTAAGGVVILPDAGDDARINALAGNGNGWAGGWVKNTFRVAAMWDPAGNLTTPLVGITGALGTGEISAVDEDGDSFAGDSGNGAFLMRKGVYTDINAVFGTVDSYPNAISADGRIVAGWSGFIGPFGTQSAMIHTTWSGPQDGTAFLAQFGVTPPVGQNAFAEFIDMSADGNSFLAIAGSIVPDLVYVTLPDSFADLGGGAAGTAGTPSLDGFGWLNPGMTAGIGLVDAPASSLAVVAFGGAYNPTPLFGGIVGPLPAAGFLFLPTDANGDMEFTFTWPVTLPSGWQTYVQAGVIDLGVPSGIALSNTLQMTGN